MLHDDERPRLDNQINRIADPLIRCNGVPMAHVAFSNLDHGQLARIANRLLERLIDAQRQTRAAGSERDYWRSRYEETEPSSE